MGDKNLYVVAVTGGRNYANRDHVHRVLSEIHESHGIDVIVHGGCGRKYRAAGSGETRLVGADLLADAWAVENLVLPCEFRVPDEHWNRIGRSAGPSRNLLMLECTHPNLLVAFPGGDGTNGCVRIGKRLNLELRDERNSK